MAERQTRKRKPDEAGLAGGGGGAGSSAAADDDDLQAWLRRCGSGWCPEIVGPLLDELGAESVSDLLDLEAEDVSDMCGKLKKLQAKKLRRALQEVTEAGGVASQRRAESTAAAAAPAAAATAQAAAAATEEERRKRRKKLTESNKCPICLEAAVLPVTLGCGHSGCRDCLQRINDQGGRECPSCRKVHTGPLVVNISMRASLEEEFEHDPEYMERQQLAVAALEAEKAATQRAQDQQALSAAGAAALSQARSELISASWLQCLSPCALVFVYLGESQLKSRPPPPCTACNRHVQQQCWPCRTYAPAVRTRPPISLDSLLGLPDLRHAGGSRSQLNQRLDARGLARGGDLRSARSRAGHERNIRGDRVDRLLGAGLGGIRGLTIGTQIEVPVRMCSPQYAVRLSLLRRLTGCIWGCCWLQGFGRAVLTGFKHANFRIKYADGSERSLKRAEILRYYAASLA